MVVSGSSQAVPSVSQACPEHVPRRRRRSTYVGPLPACIGSLCSSACSMGDAMGSASEASHISHAAPSQFPWLSSTPPTPSTPSTKQAGTLRHRSFTKLAAVGSSESSSHASSHIFLRRGSIRPRFLNSPFSRAARDLGGLGEWG